MCCLSLYLIGGEATASPPPIGGEVKKSKFGVATPFTVQTNSSLDGKDIQLVDSPEKKAKSEPSFSPLKLIKKGIRKIFGPDFPAYSKSNPTKNIPAISKGFQSEEEPDLCNYFKRKECIPSWSGEEVKTLESEHEDLTSKLVLTNQPKPVALDQEESNWIDTSSNSTFSLGAGLLRGLEVIRKIVDSTSNPVYQIADLEIRQTFNHIEKNGAAYINNAKTKGEAILIHADESKGLHRSLVVTAEGDVFLLFNRGSKGDEKFFGTEKAVSRAIHLNSGEIYASEAMDESYQDINGQRPSPK